MGSMCCVLWDPRLLHTLLSHHNSTSSLHIIHLTTVTTIILYSDRVIQRASIWWSIVMVLRLIYVRTMCAIVVWHFSLALRLWFSTLALWLWLKLSFEWLWTILPTTAISPMGFDRNIFWTLCIKLRIANIGNIRFGDFHSNAHVCILGGCCGWCRNV